MKRKTLEIQREIYTAIQENPGITLSQLERKIRTNPTSLKKHCEELAFLRLIRIEKSDTTTLLFLL
ncbi:hypothetical protein COV20_00810 [Candidatus Woesearchaeota archaeon CG10_big_fil_rev_8_21_14_0_10_45_16]|nr:MAG: hypothetical protein COV20_00810 [Candidatus Woesearchaeota archaeon CG10_big_fil_rev_8_21_14_0_10_45_16]